MGTMYSDVLKDAKFSDLDVGGGGFNFRGGGRGGGDGGGGGGGGDGDDKNNRGPLLPYGDCRDSRHRADCSRYTPGMSLSCMELWAQCPCSAFESVVRACQLVSLNVKVFSWLSQSTFGARILGTGGLLILLRSVRDKQQPSLSDSI
eukprot:scaffold3886_cov399-Prasinococcus_capsulatus_cf.AAC.3